MDNSIIKESSSYIIIIRNKKALSDENAFYRLNDTLLIRLYFLVVSQP